LLVGSIAYHHPRRVEDASSEGQRFVPDPTQAETHAGFDTIASTPIERTSLERGAVVGRYVVLRELGAGGMGVVYAAYDPELDRKIALKLLLSRAVGDVGRTRLLREAQALAKLSHPHVVAIYDVGTVGEQVWLAMELVDGQTLGRWLGSPRTWREVLDVMHKAGQGLSAAHAAGLSHRDFKPDNVMVGRDGRVRVMDFGLARIGVEGGALLDAEGIADELESESAVAARATALTQAGAVVGTPRYMAPEQLAGAEVTAAADQFSFCVSLWEALFGSRPFAGETVRKLVASVLKGKLRSPEGRAVPGWLRRVCERGLAIDPARRWPSMAALLDALAEGQARARRRKGLAMVGVLVLLGGGVEGYRRWGLARRAEACEVTGDEVQVAWTAERGQQLHAGLVATGVGYARTTADKVVPRLEQQAQAWREARVEACLDAEVRGVWDVQMVDRSLWCLDERRSQLESLVDALTQADASVLENAVAATTDLAPVAACRDESMLAVLDPPPPERREAVRAVRADVTRAANLEWAGRHEPGLELAKDALVRAEALQWAPLTAAARLQLGTLFEATSAPDAAEAALVDAYFEASRGVAPQVAFDAASALVFMVGYRAGRHDDGRLWARLAEQALAELRDDDGLARAGLLHNLGNLDAAAGDFERARALHQEALELREQALGPDHSNVGESLGYLASVPYRTGDFEEAKALFERALAIQKQALGPDHPAVGLSLNNLGVVYSITGDYEPAKQLFVRALPIVEQGLGASHPAVVEVVTNLGMSYMDTGEPEAARPLLERALAIREQALGADDPLVGSILESLASVDVELGDYERAKALAERALAIADGAAEGDDAGAAASFRALAGVFEVLGDEERAKGLRERGEARGGEGRGSSGGEEEKR
jgi:tetratricopeptide (TPR) repeat protein